MIKGVSLQELAEETMRQARAKKDYIADTRRLNALVDMVDMDKSVKLAGNGNGLRLTETAHGQLASWAKIPKQYYDRMRNQEPNLWAENMNVWLHREPQKRMIRTLDNKIRAFLSDRYRPLDNVDLMEAILPTLNDIGAEIKSCNLTEDHLYIQAVTPKVFQPNPDPKKVGDKVHAGVVISNSEVGKGSLDIERLIYTLSCLNGAIVGRGLKKYHAGSRLTANDMVEYWSDETRRATDKAFFLQTKDLVADAVNETTFKAQIEDIKRSREDKIEEVEPTIEAIANHYVLQERESSSILDYLAAGGDLSRYGLGNAITRTAEDSESYDRAIELERFGGEVMTMSGREWKGLVRY